MPPLGRTSAVLAALLAWLPSALAQGPPPAMPDLPAIASAGPAEPAPLAPTPTNNAPSDPYSFLAPGSPGSAPLGGPGQMFGRVVGQVPPTASFQSLWLPAQPVRSQPTSLGSQQQNFSFLAPVYQDSTNELLFSSHVRWETIQTHAVLPTSRLPFPNDLWNIGLGGTYRHLFDNGWIAGGSLQVGSASDRPFHGIDEMNVGLSGFLRIPWGDRDAWLFSLAYSPTSQLPFPIPGIAYSWVPSDRFQANLGIPFSLTWRPLDDLLLNLSYMPLTNVNARATYRLWGPVRLYTGFLWSNQGYFLAGRADRNERFLYYDMRAVGGVQASFGAWSLDLSSGYVFDRYYTQTTNASLNGGDRVDIGAGPFLSLGLRLRW